MPMPPAQFVLELCFAQGLESLHDFASRRICRRYCQGLLFFRGRLIPGSELYTIMPRGIEMYKGQTTILLDW